MFLLRSLINHALTLAAEASVGMKNLQINGSTYLQINHRKYNQWRQDRHKAKRPKR